MTKDAEGLGSALKLMESVDSDLGVLTCDNGLTLVLARSKEAGEALKAGVNKLQERFREKGRYR